MTEKVLEYERAIVPQETFYWCGPASVQMQISSHGMPSDERTLARELGTTENGTDWIGQITNVLNARLGGGWITVEMPHDPPTQAEKTRLWDDIVRSIDSGNGVVANIVAPPNNYPRGVKGSVSPAYGGGTVYHYFSVMGYDDVERAVWIADSGFRPFGYWMSFEQLASLIPPKGYACKPLGVPAAPAPAPDADGVVDPEILARVMGYAVSPQRYAELAPAFTKALKLANCNTPERAAMFAAQLGHESVGLKYMAELWGPTSDQNSYEWRQDLGNTQAGDGYRFKGRGPIQITGRNNYTRLSEWAHDHGYVPSPTFFVDHPEELEGPEYGFLGAVWYWTVARDLNAYADAMDINGATRAINGGLNGIDDRLTRYRKALELGPALLTEQEDIMAARKVENFKGIGVDLDFMLAWIDKREARNEVLQSAILDALKGEGTAAALMAKFDEPLADKYKG